MTIFKVSLLFIEASAFEPVLLMVVRIAKDEQYSVELKQMASEILDEMQNKVGAIKYLELYDSAVKAIESRKA